MAQILSLSEARALKNRSKIHAVGLYDPALGAWLSKEHQTIMGPGDKEAVLIELPCDTEPR